MEELHGGYINMIKEYLYNWYKKFLTFFGDIYLAFEPPACRIENIDELRKLAEPGDLLLRQYDPYLDGKFIPGTYSHSGFVSAIDEITHSIAEGVCRDHIGNFVIDTDGFCLVRPPYIDDDYKAAAIKRANWHVDTNKTKYDFFFKPEGNEFYCHEFTVDCLKYGGVGIPLRTRRFGIWPFRYKKKIFLAEDIIEAGAIIYEFKGGESKC